MSALQGNSIYLQRAVAKVPRAFMLPEDDPVCKALLSIRFNQERHIRKIDMLVEIQELDVPTSAKHAYLENDGEEDLVNHLRDLIKWFDGMVQGPLIVVITFENDFFDVDHLHETFEYNIMRHCELRELRSRVTIRTKFIKIN